MNGNTREESVNPNGNAQFYEEKKKSWASKHKALIIIIIIIVLIIIWWIWSKSRKGKNAKVGDKKGLFISKCNNDI